MSKLTAFVIDEVLIMQKAYHLLCIIFANKEISRRIPPDDKASSLAALENKFLASEVSRLLLEIAVSMRVLDDAMKRKVLTDPVREAYDKQKRVADGYDYGMFENLTLREACNKIIHSEVLGSYDNEGDTGHEMDLAHMYQGEPRTIEWKHIDKYLRLCGKDFKGEEWHVMLDTQVFVTAVYEVLEAVSDAK